MKNWNQHSIHQKIILYWLKDSNDSSIVRELFLCIRQLNSIACLTLRELGYDTTKYEYKGMNFHKKNRIDHTQYKNNEL